VQNLSELKTDSYPIHDIMTMPYASNALLVGIIELDLFTKLSKNPSTLSELCQITDLQERPARILLKAFTALSFLSKENDRYCLTPLSETFFVKGKPFYLGDAISIFKDNQVTYEQMRRAVRQNKPCVYENEDDIFEVHSQDDEKALAFTRWMHIRSLVTGSSVVENFDFSGYHQLVDVGGGSGGISIMIVKQNPHLKAAIFDMPPVCKTAEKMIAEFELAESISTISGDMFIDEFGDKFPKDTDIVVFSRILHDWPIQKCRYLLKQANNVLPPGGTVMIIESLIDESNSERLSPFLENLAMLYCTQGEQFDKDEIDYLLQETGFNNISIEAIASNYNLITANKL
jgi:ubiquinone/menaquinone biosynthesis C-methylase UbiE